MNAAERIADFLAGDGFAVVGATRVRAKFGNKVLRSYVQAGRTAYPVHPREREIEGLRAYPDLASIPAPIHGVSIITPPAVTERIVEEALALGIRRLWMQPGAESRAAIARAEAAGADVIAGGPCVLVELGFPG